jgi:hypothetical protein
MAWTPLATLDSFVSQGTFAGALLYVHKAVLCMTFDLTRLFFHNRIKNIAIMRQVFQLRWAVRLRELQTPSSAPTLVV